MSKNFFNCLVSKLNIKLNEEQMEAVNHVRGEALVLAGPGSGKTTVIVSRCMKLLFDRNLSNNGGILTVAFNKDAAEQMKKRFINYNESFRVDDNKAVFSTFHSFCLNIIRKYERIYNTDKLRIINELDQNRILQKIYNDHNKIILEDVESNKLINDIEKSRTKKDNPAVNSNFKDIGIIAKKYEAAKASAGIIDYEDMLYYAYDILNSCEEITAGIKNTYEFIQVDEAQDLSEIQMKILIKINSGNMFIVGDDDQGIYGFRGAKSENMLNLGDVFTDIKLYKLNTNYRSTERIVKISGDIIKNNSKRYDKCHRTYNEIGSYPVCRSFCDDFEMMNFIYADIVNNSGSKGILFRNGASAVLPAFMLYLHSLKFAASNTRCTFFNHWMTEELTGILLNKSRGGNPNRLLNELFYKENYMEVFSRKAEILFQRKETLDRIKVTFEYIAGKSNNVYEMKNNIDEVKSIFSGERVYNDPEIYLSTVHSAKGLEYDTVYIIDLYKDEFPKSSSEEELEEERRLFYVAMTRARKKLYLLYPLKRNNKCLEASIFYDEVKQAIKVTKRHKKT